MRRLAQGLLFVVLVVAVARAQALATPGTGAEVRPAAIVAGEVIDVSAVDELIRPQLVELQRVREQALEALIGQVLIRREATNRGMTEEALERREIEAKVAVTPADVKAVYEANRGALFSVPEAEALARIERSLTLRRRRERRDAFVSELRTKYDVRVLLEPARLEVETGNAPVRGNPSAPVTIMEFSDFECPYCVRVRPTVARIRETYGDKVNWVFRHFPLAMHPLARKAGEAAACADEQGKFWEMHDRLWASGGKLRVSDLKASAAEIGLDSVDFDRCLDSGRHAEVVQRDLAAGSGYGVSATPAFFVNGRPLIGAQPFEAFRRVIDDELRRVGAAAAVSK